MIAASREVANAEIEIEAVVLDGGPGWRCARADRAQRLVGQAVCRKARAWGRAFVSVEAASGRGRRGPGASPRFAEVTISPSAPAGTIEIELTGGVFLRIAGDARVDDTVAILSRLPTR